MCQLKFSQIENPWLKRISNTHFQKNEFQLNPLLVQKKKNVPSLWNPKIIHRQPFQSQGIQHIKHPSTHTMQR